MNIAAENRDREYAWCTTAPRRVRGARVARLTPHERHERRGTMADYYNPGHVQREARILQQLADAQGLSPAIRRLVREAAKEHGHGEARACQASGQRCQVYACDRVGKGQAKPQLRCRTERE